MEKFIRAFPRFDLMIRQKGLEEIATYVDQLGTLFIETTEPSILRVLAEEVAKAGLEDDDVLVFLPEINYDSMFYNENSAEVSNVGGKYYIFLYPIQMRMDDCPIRRAIRHEIAHIKYGDVDREALPGIFENIYRMFEERRARIYERG